MPYQEQLANRVREALQEIAGVEEKNMMGGLIFMVNGKMCIGVLNDDLMFRIDPKIYDEVLSKRGCREMDFTGKPLKGFVFVEFDGYKNSTDFNDWIDLALTFNQIAKASPKKRGRSRTKQK